MIVWTVLNFVGFRQPQGVHARLGMKSLASVFHFGSAFLRENNTSSLNEPVRFARSSLGVVVFSGSFYSHSVFFKRSL